MLTSFFKFNQGQIFWDIKFALMWQCQKISNANVIVRSLHQIVLVHLKCIPVQVVNVFAKMLWKKLIVYWMVKHGMMKNVLVPVQKILGHPAQLGMFLIPMIHAVVWEYKNLLWHGLVLVIHAIIFWHWLLLYLFCLLWLQVQLYFT